MRRLYPALVVVLVVALVLPTVALAAPAESGGFSYQVRLGDTLYRIGRRFGVSPQAIASANGLVNPNLIYAGQWLWIPSAPYYPPYPPYGCRYSHYVQPGQTLYSIGRWYGVSPWAIAAANGIYNLNVIYAGTTLCIP